MPLPMIPKALYPLVPNAPGVPALLRSGAKIIDMATFGLLGASDALDLLIGAEPVRWGVFDQFNAPVAIADSILSFDYSNGSKVSNYPVENGAFASYNKVANPYDAKITMTCGGSDDARAAFINALDSAADSIDLYTILTPEKSYLSANIERVDYARSASKGAGIIIADLYLIEVRQTATAAFSKPQSVSAVDPKSQGQLPSDPIGNVQSSLLSGAANALASVSALKSQAQSALATAGQIKTALMGIA